MICTDCREDGHESTTVFDVKQMGEVCPRCERVYSMFSPNPNHKHYASEKACKARMARDQKERHLGTSTAAIVKRILKPID